MNLLFQFDHTQLPLNIRDLSLVIIIVMIQISGDFWWFLFCGEQTGLLDSLL